MARFIIHGRKRLSGRYRVCGNKNAALPMLAAAVLTDEPVTLANVPRIRDVSTMLEILADIGVQVAQEGSTVRLCARGLRRSRLRPDLCRQVRSSILFAGPLGARLGRATLYPPGGDVIGRRRLDTHFDGLRALGIEIEGGDSFRLRRQRLQGARILLDEASVTATENLLMAAVLAPGLTTLYNAACEPHVADLGRLLTAMGARIRGLGTNRIEVEGVDELHGAEWTVPPDPIEAGSFFAAAAATGGSLRMETPLDPDVLDVISRPFQKLGLRWQQTEDGGLYLPERQRLRVHRDLGAAIPKVEDGPWPAFPSDLMSVTIVAATQAAGVMLFFEKMFESRMFFVDSLIAMGAGIVQCDPHRVLVAGPAHLHGLRMASPDIRAGMALLIAALCAKGESVIENAETVDRGYEDVDGKLRELGADIERDSGR